MVPGPWLVDDAELRIQPREGPSLYSRDSPFDLAASCGVLVVDREHPDAGTDEDYDGEACGRGARSVSRPSASTGLLGKLGLSANGERHVRRTVRALHHCAVTLAGEMNAVGCKCVEWFVTSSIIGANIQLTFTFCYPRTG